MENKSLLERFSEWINQSISLKLITIGILTLILLIPMGQVENLISERQNRNTEVVNDISSSWGTSQSIKGQIWS